MPKRSIPVAVQPVGSDQISSVETRHPGGQYWILLYQVEFTRKNSVNESQLRVEAEEKPEEVEDDEVTYCYCCNSIRKI